ncbi:MAG: hypothetical protein HOD85_06295 [Deltaproteobacteria bacterium]|nr:hypothetical protein [Deltaproteobacteria bacterium]
MDKELNINGNDYRIKQYKFTERSQLLWKVTKMLGEAGGALLNGALGEGDILDKDIDFGGVLIGFLGQIEPYEHTEFIKETIQSLTVSPKEIHKDQDQNGEKFENYFSDHFADHLPLFIEILRHNLMSAVSEDIKKKFLEFTRIFSEPSNLEKAESTPA